MTKKELCWFLVRVIGICMLLNAVRYAATLIESLLVVGNNPAAPMMAPQTSALMTLLCWEAIASFLAGIYLLKRGQVVFKWLSFEP